MTSPPMDRRTFLARAGILGAAVGIGGLMPPSALAGAVPSAAKGPSGLVELLRPVLDQLSRDTFNGLTTFVMPGPDAYSAAQGTPRAEPGALDTKLPDFIMAALDDFVPFPEELARPVTAAVATGLSGVGLHLLDGLPLEIGNLDDALQVILADGGAIPLSLAVAVLLNLLATQVNPAAVNGPFLSPFSRLSFAEKAAAFSLLEGADSNLVALLDTKFPEPLQDAVSGLLKFVGGALLEFCSFGGYCEYAVYDAATKRLTATPVGWRLSGYFPPPGSDGWDDFKGYYQGRQEVSD